MSDSFEKNFAELLEEFRTRRGINKKQLALSTKLTPGYVSLLASGRRKTPSAETVMILMNALELNEEERTRFLEAAGYPTLLTTSTTDVISNASPSPSLPVKRSESLLEEQRYAIPEQDVFYGRERELEDLQQFILGTPPVRCLAILGMGGVGKTSLAIALAERVQGEFEYTAWYPFQTLSEHTIVTIITDCLRFFSALPAEHEEDGVQSLLNAFSTCLESHRCLIILDNFESLLKSGSLIGEYEDGYDEYGKLLELFCSRPHWSCLLLTSREKPKEVALLEGSWVKSLVLAGIEDEDGRKILRDKGLIIETDAWRNLVQLYSGNPFALQLVSPTIRDVFGGDIAAFLSSLAEQQEQAVAVNVVHSLLDQQFQRLTDIEKEVMYWLAIEREAVDTKRLREDILRSGTKPDLLGVLESLLRRSLIERRDARRFGLRPLVMDFVTDQLVQAAYQEIATQDIALLDTYALIKAETEDYIRIEQSRAILAPLQEKLVAHFEQWEIEEKLHGLLNILRHDSQKNGYAAGNILNLLLYLEYDNLHSYDFSFLTVRQAYLLEKGLPGVNFTHANLYSSVFADTFGSVLSVALSPDGKLLAAGTANGEVRVWQMDTRRLLYTWKSHSDWVRTVAFSADGRFLASGSHDQTIRIWDVNTGQGVALLTGHENRVRSVAFGMMNGVQVLASSSDDKTIRIWNLQTSQPIHTLTGHSDKINALAFSPNSRLLVSVSHDETICLWEVESGSLLQQLHDPGAWIWSVAFSSDTKFACGDESGAISLWERNPDYGVPTFRRRWKEPIHSARVYTVSFSSDDEDILLSGSDDETVRLLDTSTGRSQLFRGHTNGVRSCVSHDGCILVSGSDDETVRIWDAEKNQCLHTLKGYSGWVFSVAFNAHTPLLASGGEDRRVRVWDIESGKRLHTLREHKHRVRAVAFSPDASKFASASDDQTVRTWETETGFLLLTLRGHRQRVRSVSFSPDSSKIASASDDETIRVWETETGMCLKVIDAHLSRVYSVTWSPDGRFLASSSEDQHIYLWDASTYQKIGTFSGHRGRIYCVRFSPDNRFLISGGDDMIVRQWDVASQRCIREVQGHSKRICSLTYTRDGHLFASASEDKTAKVWDANTGELVYSLTGHTGKVSSVASYETSYYATGSYDGTIRVWDAQTGEHSKTLRSPRPYENVDITDVRGITAAQKATLKILGAIEAAPGERSIL